MIEEGTPPSLVFHLSTNRIGNCKGNIKVRYRFGRAIPKADIKWFAQSDVDKCSVMTSDSDIIDEFLGSIKQQPMLSFVISRKKEMIIENIFIPKESPEAAEDFENRCIELISKWKEFMDIDQQQKR